MTRELTDAMTKELTFQDCRFKKETHRHTKETRRHTKETRRKKADFGEIFVYKN